MDTIVLAGGYASRMSPTTDEVPKLLLPVAGRPVLTHVLDSLGDMYQIIDSGTCYIAINRKFESDFKNFLDGYRGEFEIELLVEDSTGNNNKKGSARAVNAVIEQTDIDYRDGLLVTAGDTISSLNFYDFLTAYRDSPDTVLTPIWDVRELEKAKSFTIVTEGSHETQDSGLEVCVLDEIIEKPLKAKSSIITLATYLYSSNAVNHFGEFLDDGENNDSIGTFLPWLKSKYGTEVKGMRFEGYWFDIGSHEALAEANSFFRVRV